MKRLSMHRRAFLRYAIGGGAMLGLQGLVARGALSLNHDARGQAPQGAGGYGALAPVAARNTGETLLELPAGFQYTVFGKAGALMADGTPTPIAHDGMAAFQYGTDILLIRNHEVRDRNVGSGVIGSPRRTYDAEASGGTVSLIVNPTTRELVRDFVSLSGTVANCAGGPTPWGSWISCEETAAGPGAKFGQPHGYCFEVSTAVAPQAASADAAAPAEGEHSFFLPMARVVDPLAPVPLKAMGRFYHEAVAVDPATGIVYETEDRTTAGFYRFIPDQRGRLAEGGRLQMLAVAQQPNYDTRQNQQVGVTLPATWVDIPDPDPAAAEQNPLAVYEQGYDRGGATFARLEGCWYGSGKIYVNATTGGDQGRGQVWQYQPRGDGGELTLIFESPGREVLDAPDNICVSPRGGLVLCEDSSVTQYVRGLTPQGLIFDFVRNLAEDKNGDTHEFAGATFSPDGRTLFVNVQTPGMTFAIWGPWEQGAL
jgi:secreted PhoX family phosphatase